MSYPTDLNDLAERAHKTALEHGFWEGENENIPSKLMLIVSECAEALEVYREHDVGKSRGWINDNGKPEGFVFELADIVIRVMDLAEHYDLNLQQAVFDKMAYNSTRTWRHGGKRV